MSSSNETETPAAAPQSWPLAAIDIPADVLGVVIGFLGYYHLPTAAAVSKSWYNSDELTAARARHGLTVAAMPNCWRMDRTEILRSRQGDASYEYLSLCPRVIPGQGNSERTIVCDGYSSDWETPARNTR